jgi:Mrp family chromosome partitioning ATPase
VKSFIERAIEMAKLQRQEAERSERAAGGQAEIDPDKRRRRRPAVAPVQADGHPVVVASHLQPIDLAKAPQIVTDATVLRHNRVLVESHLRQPAENAYRMLRTRVARQMRTNGWRKLGLTAAMPNEGKTLTAINLAVTTAAERVQPVVLIDLDLRRPRIHRYFGIGDRQFTSASDYLEGRTNSLDQLVVSLPELGLHCVLGAQPIERPSDLLASPRGQAFLHDLAARLPNALLIFDLPPLLSTDDPLVVAPMLDALLLIVAEKVAPRDDIASAAKLLAEFNLLGVVLNKSLERSERGYYDY